MTRGGGTDCAGGGGASEGVGGGVDGLEHGGPAEDAAEGEVLDDGKFAEDFFVVHFKHTLHERLVA